MRTWQPYPAPLHFLHVQTYAIAQLNRRGVIPVYRGGIRLFRHEGENLRDFQKGATCVIRAFLAVSDASFLRSSSTFRDNSIFFSWRDLGFSVESVGALIQAQSHIWLLVNGGPKLCPRCLAICPTHEEKLCREDP